MSLANYGVLKCRALDRKIDPATDSSPHYQVLVSDGKNKHRIAINVKSQESPSDLLYLLNDSFEHPLLNEWVNFSQGFHKLESKPGGLALDFIRGNLFHHEDMKPIPSDLSGPSNDLKELIDLYIQRAIQSPDAVVYAFGEAWGPETTTSDQYFGFRPGRGIHDIHMNQGSVGKFQEDNGVYQDGALLIHFPSRQQWVAIFLAFQSQSFHTDDRTGNPIKEEVEAVVKILAALVNPLGDDVGKESVTLINISPQTVDLNGWYLIDKRKKKFSLRNIRLKAGSTVTIALSQTEVQLPNEGGTITLLNSRDLKVHGVSYTQQQAQKQGWTIVF